ncbi:MAG TPA: rhomboid family intramembrane serine protease [Clostridiaceae bacterium]
MKWLDKLERKFGRYAIKNLIMYIVGINGFIYLLSLIDQSGMLIYNLRLDSGLVLQGQVWRLITFIFIPPSAGRLDIFVFFVLYFYYIVGTGLEQEWGSFKFNIYYLVGMLFTIVAAFIVGIDGSATYLNLSLFLAFAAVFPNYEILLFFILPMKVKYLAYLNWAFLAYTIITAPIPAKVAAIVSVLNYFLFFGKDLFRRSKTKKQVYTNRKRYNIDRPKVIAFHKCTVCGITEIEDPNMEFRYCSKCEGRHAYCSRHLIDHEHIKSVN